MFRIGYDCESEIGHGSLLRSGVLDLKLLSTSVPMISILSCAIESSMVIVY